MAATYSAVCGGYRLSVILILSVVLLLQSTPSVGFERFTYEYNPDITQLYTRNFNETIEQSIVEYGTGYWLIEFYSVFCGHCQHFRPHMEEFAHQVRSWRPHIRIGGVHCSDMKGRELCNRYHIRGVPTLLLFRSDNLDEWTEFKEHRSPMRLRRFLGRTIPDDTLPIFVDVEAVLQNPNHRWNMTAAADRVEDVHHSGEQSAVTHTDISTLSSHSGTGGRGTGGTDDDSEDIVDDTGVEIERLTSLRSDVAVSDFVNEAVSLGRVPIIIAQSANITFVPPPPTNLTALKYYERVKVLKYPEDDYNAYTVAKEMSLSHKQGGDILLTTQQKIAEYDWLDSPLDTNECAVAVYAKHNDTWYVTRMDRHDLQYMDLDKWFLSLELPEDRIIVPDDLDDTDNYLHPSVNDTDTDLAGAGQCDLASLPKEDEDRVSIIDVAASLRFMLTDVVGMQQFTRAQLVIMHQFLKLVATAFPRVETRASIAGLAAWMEIQKDAKDLLTTKQWIEKLSAWHIDGVEPKDSKPHSCWVHCLGSQPNYRRYPCGLWLLFHSLTVNTDRQAECPTHTLKTIRYFVGEFFSCTYCREHFLERSKNVTSEVFSWEDSVLWLWRMHNEVNMRLHDDVSSDPQHPKINFPTPGDCPTCWTGSYGPVTSSLPEYDPDAVLAYLVSYYGDDK
eukprot:GFYU01003022.1.p1 GENE.GFYU01003022.1~~GFYU01003022.1.p1  ORF type:complete len:673 (+),score=171.20 GFYU01003022.1:149-2167(+)